MSSDEKSLQPVSSEIIQINQRLQHVEQITDTVKHIADNAVDSWNKHLEQKTRQAFREIEVSESQHSRSVKALAYIVTLVFILCMASIVVKEFELVKIIIGSSLAVGAGAGLSTLFSGGSVRKRGRK